MNNAKVKHVRRATQTRRHRCHWPNCTKQVPLAMWGCFTHWFSLPKWLRDKVWNAYEIGQEERMSPSFVYLAVMKEVETWIAEYGDRDWR